MIYRIVLRGIVATILVAAFFVLIQDFLIFPGLLSSKLLGFTNTPPHDVIELSAISSDGQVVQVWRMEAKNPSKKLAALLFHGNAESLTSFAQFQRWFSALGITSYSVEYRGYSGRGTGWPSEAGMYADAEAAFRLLQFREQIDPKDIVVLGSSIGSGTAAYVAQKHNVGTLVLLSPYTTLRNVAAETPLFGYLAPFLKYTFPTIDYVEGLTRTCVVVAHGKRDITIPFSHSEILERGYRGSSSFVLIASENASHNDLMLLVQKQLAEAIGRCTATSS
jgi:fermentation-respiration switch protein FrsA (DUF1100 family)